MILRLLLLVGLLFSPLVFSQYSGNACTMRLTSNPGVCTPIGDCPYAIRQLQRRRPNTLCGFEESTKIICCPSIRPPTPPPTTPAPGNLTISERKCEEYTEAAFEYITIFQPLKGRETLRVDKCGHKVVPLIFGGDKARPREFPHMALIGHTKGSNIEWRCGGTLISDQYVLTAAHCLVSRDLGAPTHVRLGELDYSTETDDARPETLNIVEVIKHPKYRTNSKYDDIGLVKMERKVNLNPYVRPACLPTNFDLRESRAIASGWGKTESGQNSPHLLNVKLSINQNSDCDEQYRSKSMRKGVNERTQICAGETVENKNTCTGDSGGPLQVFHPVLYCMYNVIGITSFGIPCGDLMAPGVYTRVYPYVGWISNIVWGAS